MTDEWQDIATAPRDGRWVILGWIVEGRLEYVKKSKWVKDHWLDWWTPTHWKSA